MNLGKRVARVYEKNESMANRTMAKEQEGTIIN